MNEHRASGEVQPALSTQALEVDDHDELRIWIACAMLVLATVRYTRLATMVIPRRILKRSVISRTQLQMKLHGCRSNACVKIGTLAEQMSDTDGMMGGCRCACGHTTQPSPFRHEPLLRLSRGRTTQHPPPRHDPWLRLRRGGATQTTPPPIHFLSQPRHGVNR